LVVVSFLFVLHSRAARTDDDFFSHLAEGAIDIFDEL